MAYGNPGPSGDRLPDITRKYISSDWHGVVHWKARHMYPYIVNTMAADNLVIKVVRALTWYWPSYHGICRPRHGKNNLKIYTYIYIYTQLREKDSFITNITCKIQMMTYRLSLHLHISWYQNKIWNWRLADDLFFVTVSKKGSSPRNQRINTPFSRNRKMPKYCSAQSYCTNQCWFIIEWTLVKKFDDIAIKCNNFHKRKQLSQNKMINLSRLFWNHCQMSVLHLKI